MAEFESLTHRFRANLYSLQPGANKVGKRNRQPLSCAYCRSKKLKCDRGHPCDTCVKRADPDNCIYGRNDPVPAAARPEASNGSAFNSNSNTVSTHSRGVAQRRLQHLEQLVMRMVNSSSPASSSTTSSDKPNGAAILSDSVDSSIAKEGHLQVGSSESRYVGPTHWSAILENIQELKTALGVDHASSTELDESEDPEAPDSEDLFGSTGRLSLAQILAHALPTRLELDRRLSTYFKTQYMVTPLIHKPQFQRQYEQFWQTPLETSPHWLSILFSICCISAIVDEAVGSPGSTPGDQRSMRTTFLNAAGHCIQLGGYVLPKRYAVEALVLYAQCRYRTTMDPSREVGTVLAILVRLAYRSGYHRDPSHFPHFSAFEGEMRRRAWSSCQQMDMMVSFQLGLPNLIPPDSWDTRPPRNLVDTDFDEHTTVLPPSRSEEEPTPLVYFIAKSRLMTAFSKICAHALSFRVYTEQDIMALDAEMRAAHATMPNVLRIRPMARSFADPPYLIMLRLNCEFLYQKSLCVLHRKYMTQDIDRYPASTQACLDAAAAITRHMLDIHKELQPGGQLYSDRWMLSSFTMNDFYLACMVLCLGLSMWKKANPGKSLNQDDRMGSLFELLRASFAICEERSPTSNEARRVTGVLRVILGQTALGSTTTTAFYQHQVQQEAQQKGQSTTTTRPFLSNPFLLPPSHIDGSAGFPPFYDFNLAPLSVNEQHVSGATSSSRTQDTSRTQRPLQPGDGDGVDCAPGFGPHTDNRNRPPLFNSHHPSPSPSTNPGPNISRLLSPTILNSFIPFSPTSIYESTGPRANPIQQNSALSGNHGSTPNVDLSAGPDIPNTNTSSSISPDVDMEMNPNPDFASDFPPFADIDWTVYDQWMAIPSTDSTMPLSDGNLPFGSLSIPVSPRPAPTPSMNGATNNVDLGERMPKQEMQV
ncbi:hypothetical protein A1O1_04014 [Capronia coronata CBS 617.96]|uniref:Zn(2)-C6 fungal-type domain-containing protein n=1 Tax=Capronia coronata CBS 617.96 TaxID=1182541 RepID=W9YEH2_9EURO|nr:uncharacterized protein A1O1_04014 [Capronia coronata CBS 617.96]EXJ90908.1 hypothetical protein A1O1_04014 [Capronia coronata CBS 617.96]